MTVCESVMHPVETVAWILNLDLVLVAFLAAVTKHRQKQLKDRFTWLRVQGYNASRQEVISAGARDSCSCSGGRGLQLSCLFLCVQSKRASHHGATHILLEVFSPQSTWSRNTGMLSSLFLWWFSIPRSWQSRVTTTDLSGAADVLYSPLHAQSRDHRSQQPHHRRGTTVPTSPMLTSHDAQQVRYRKCTLNLHF